MNPSGCLVGQGCEKVLVSPPQHSTVELEEVVVEVVVGEVAEEVVGC